MKIRMITDSASDLLSPHRPEVTVLPMTITFGEEQFRDGVDLTHRQFYEKLIEGEELPTTSQIAPAQFEEAFRDAVEAGESVVAVVLSSKLSGTYQSACIAAEEFPGKVFVVDSANATIGERILVERGLELMDQGLDAAAIAAKLDGEKADIRLVSSALYRIPTRPSTRLPPARLTLPCISRASPSREPGTRDCFCRHPAPRSPMCGLTYRMAPPRIPRSVRR